MQMPLSSLFCPKCPGASLEHDHRMEWVAPRHGVEKTTPTWAPPFLVRCIKRGGQLWRLFDPRDISAFTARDKYTWFEWSWGTPQTTELCDLSLGVLAEALREHSFVRIHRQVLVNLRFVRQARLSTRRGGTLDLWDGQTVPVSRRALPRLRHNLATLATTPPQPQTPLSMSERRSVRPPKNG